MTAAAVAPVLLVLAGETGAELAAAARAAAADVESGRDVRSVVAEHATASGRLRAVLVGADPGRVRDELDAAARSLGGLADDDWVTPAGSFCTPRPIGPAGKVAFVYPGGFTAYPGVGADLFAQFPQLRAPFEREATERFVLDSGPGDPAASVAAERALRDDLAGMVTIGMTIAVLHTRMLRDQLGIAPDGGLAYSFGETTMLFALGPLAFADWVPSELAGSWLVRRGISGQKEVVRAAWRLPADLPDDRVWASHVALTSAAAVRSVIGAFDRVFLTHLNSPGEVVIAGDPEQCHELLARLGCSAARAPVNHVLHAPVLHGVLGQFADLHRHRVRHVDPGLDLLSMHGYRPARLEVGATPATRIAQTLTRQVDFPRLVNVAYDRGYRIFIEVGPAASCTRWTSDILGSRAHVAVSADHRGRSTGTAAARVLARLISHGRPVAHQAPSGADVASVLAPLAAHVASTHRAVVRAHTEAQLHHLRGLGLAAAGNPTPPIPATTVERP